MLPFQLLLLPVFPIDFFVPLPMVSSIAFASGLAYLQSISAPRPYTKRLVFSLADMISASPIALFSYRILASSLSLELRRT
jgi:hypothetical protein